MCEKRNSRSWRTSRNGLLEPLAGCVCVCVVETEKGNVADRCRKDGGIRWGKRDSSHLRALLKEARKKCEEYSGKGI